MPSHTVRILCESRSAARSIKDAATGEIPFLWRGSSVVFQLGLTDNGQHLLAAGVGEIIVEVKNLTATSADPSLMRKVYEAEDCDDTFLAADWAGGAKQLLAAAFTVEEAALLPGTYRLIVRHESLDGSAITHLSAEFRVLDPQSGSEAIDGPPVAWEYLENLPVLRADILQSLTTEEKARVRLNIGAPVEWFYVTAGVPSSGLGVNGDHAMDKNSGIVYAKASGTWSIAFQPTNAAMLSGSGVPSAGIGANGDHYIRYVSSIATEFYTKTGGSWSKLADFSGTSLTLTQVEADRLTRTVQEFTCIGTFTTSGGDAQGAAINGGLAGQISPGTTSTGWARMLLASALTGFSGATGAGINFAQRMELDFVMAAALTSTANGSRIRLVFSEVGTGAPINAATNPLSGRGFGLEFVYTSGRMDVRLFAHNGTTYVTSAYLGSQAGNSNQFVSGRIVSNGGTISLYLAIGGNVNQGPPPVPATPTLTLTGGPTTAGPSGTPSISWLAVADGTTAPGSAGACTARPLLNKLRIIGA